MMSTAVWRVKDVPTGGGRLTSAAAADALLYAGSCAIASACLHSGLATIRVWAAIALPCYALAAAVSVAAGRYGVREFAGRPIRVAILGFVLCGAVLAPLVVEVVFRQTSGPSWAQSEVLVIEQAARAVLHDQSPYSHHFSGDGLGARTRSSGHFPYLPVMVGFGVPHALAPGLLTDARLVFGGVAAAATALALRSSTFGPDERVRIIQVLFAFPLGAMAVSSGGDDLPVMALLLLGISCLAGRTPYRLRSPAITCAALTKVTAWPVALSLIIVGGPGRRRMSRVATVGVIGAATAAAGLFIITGAWRDNLLFPLGMDTSSPAHMPSLGTLVRDSFERATSARAGRIAALTLLAGCVLIWAVVVRRFVAPSVRGAVFSAACLFIVLILCDSASRPGYLAYPANLLCWAWALGPQGARE